MLINLKGKHGINHIIMHAVKLGKFAGRIGNGIEFIELNKLIGEFNP